MKKILGNLLLFITSLMCVIVLFGCVSINSKAAKKIQPVKDLKCINDIYHFKTVSDGNYYVLVYSVDEKGKKNCFHYNKLGALKKDQTIDEYDLGLFNYYDNLGKIILYVIGCDDEPLTHTLTIDYCLKKSNYGIASYEINLNERMPQPTGITAKWYENNGKKLWKISWTDDGYGHTLRYGYGQRSITYCNCSMAKTEHEYTFSDYVESVTLKTSSCDLNKYANSDVITIVRPAENSDDNTSKNMPTDENTDKKDASGTVGNNAAKLPMTVTIDDITYNIDVNGNACATKIASKKKAVLDVVTVDGTSYPVTSIAKNACKNNKKIKSVKIGSNVTSIGKNAFRGCKKLKKITIKANKSLKIGKGAFKKINKDAKIKIKGVKGSKKKKLIKSISK